MTNPTFTIRAIFPQAISPEHVVKFMTWIEQNSNSLGGAKYDLVKSSLIMNGVLEMQIGVRWLGYTCRQVVDSVEDYLGVPDTVELVPQGALDALTISEICAFDGQLDLLGVLELGAILFGTLNGVVENWDDHHLYGALELVTTHRDLRQEFADLHFTAWHAGDKNNVLMAEYYLPQQMVGFQALCQDAKFLLSAVRMRLVAAQAATAT